MQIRRITALWLTVLAFAGFAYANDPPNGFDYGVGFRAIENVCAWPNLTQLADGTIIATIYNQPSHGEDEGDVECWASSDGGWTWSYRGTPAPYKKPNEARLNVAAGLANNGDLIVICAGWDLPSQTWNRTWVSRSDDDGATWTIDKTGFPLASSGSEYIPFGDILPGADGNLRAACYDVISPWTCDFLISTDDGYTWQLQSALAVDRNETAPLHLGSGKWLAAARSSGLTLYTSDDDGDTWQFDQQLTAANEHPGHLLELADGQILLTYGDRANPGVEAKLSSDDGQTWSDPIRLAELGGDLGYPSSVQRADGKIVSAYYSSSGGYYMGVVIWNLPVPATEQLTISVQPAEAAPLVTPSVGIHFYEPNDVVSLNATVGGCAGGSSYDFDYWTGPAADPGSASTTVTMDGGAKEVTAVFADSTCQNCDGIIEHYGQGDPVNDEGFTILSYTGGSGSGIGGFDTEDYWELTTESNNAYCYASENVIDFSTLGDFTATVRAKVISNDGSADNASMTLAIGEQWMMLMLDESENVYHNYAITRTAGVYQGYKDETPVALDIDGNYPGQNYRVFGFGDNITSGGGAVVRYSYAKLEEGIHIPSCYPYPEGDYTHDCLVDLADLACIAHKWLNPYDLYDFAELQNNWD